MKINGYSSHVAPQPTTTPNQKTAPVRRETESAATKPVDLSLLAQGSASTVAVRLPAEGYAARLTDAEKKALDAIFARYRENPALAQRLEPAAGEVGRLVDVKV